MNAMIFAAGLGTRLRPLTNDKPKALVEIQGKTMLELALRKLENAGITKTVVNIHHHPNQMIEFLDSYNSPKMEVVISHEKDQLLDTGGGLLKAKPLFDKGNPILLYNVDILSTASLPDFMKFHQSEKPLVSLMVKDRKTTRHLLFNEQMTLCGWENLKTGEKTLVHQQEPLTPLGFQGIHIVDPHIFDLIEESGAFPIMELYLRLASTQILKGYESKNDLWFDIGTPEKLEETKLHIASVDSHEFKRLFQCDFSPPD